MRPGGRPAADYKVVLAQDEVDRHAEIRESRTEVVGDPLLPLRARQCRRRTQVVADVVVGEHVVGEVGVPSVPHFLVEPPPEGLVVLGRNGPIVLSTGVSFPPVRVDSSP
jgi:hypothetical protein